MKLIKSIFLVPLCILGMTSCHDFLEVKPVNTMIPTTLEDYQAVLLGGYPVNDIFINTEYMTDNVYANSGTQTELSQQAAPWFKWAESHQLDGRDIDPYWNQLYKSIYYSNSVIDELKTRSVDEKQKALYETILGEAYALRAFSYFYLANLYADVYSSENLKKPCVPMPLTAEDVHVNTKDNVRESIETIWNQIVSDLNVAASKLNGKARISEFRFDYLSVKLLTARVNLFMNNLDDAIANASIIISKRMPWDMNALQEIIDTKGTKKIFSDAFGLIDTDYKSEVMFSVGGGTRGAGGNPFYHPRTLIKPDTALLTLYIHKEQYDYRRLIFESHANLEEEEMKKVGRTMYHMYSHQPESGIKAYYIALKTSEAYLIRAEAYARKGGNETKAINDLNILLQRRIAKADFKPLKADDFANSNAILEVVKDERRKETAFDAGLRWFDLRRFGKQEIEHIYIEEQEERNVKLKQNDPRYILQIPVSEQKNSPDMILNPR